MSGFGFGGGFGQNNNQQQQSTFGGFGANNNATPAFGSNTTNTGFGSNTNTTGGGLFGATSGGFGNSGGFGATNAASSPFGAKPSGFGAPAATNTNGGGLFGSNTNTAASNTGTGFGFGASNTTASSPFGGGATSGGLFGQQNKPATSGGFGAPAATPAFGAASNSTGFGGFGAGAATMGGAAGACPGTGNVPFAATVEKEPNSTTNQQNSFQNICFQAPYQKFSQEELRVVDYQQGRRYGNGTAGATGAFGQTNFGGFGASNSTGGFGSTATAAPSAFGAAATTNPFGGATTTSNAFGGASGGGLFGAAQNKPATGGLFGSTPAATTQPAGGLFGGGGGFGSTPAAATGGFGANTGGGLFGPTPAAAAKPSFSFGGASTGTTGGFGAAANNTGGGLFGGNTQQTQTAASNPFGANPAQPASGGLFGGGFGAANQQQAQQPATTSLFGGQTKPATTGLFGAQPSGATGGLFGSTPAQAGNSNPFGGSTANSGGGLFGAAKPAATGGLFGGGAGTTANAGGGLFGGGGFGSNQQNQQQQNTSGGLFGGANQTAQQKPSLFGGATGGSSLFGGQQQQQQQQNGNSLFGGSSNQQPQQQQQGQSFGNSLFGGPNQQSFTASISDNSAFGNSMFNGLASPEVSNPGPIATPLSSLSKQKKPGVLPMYKLNPASSISRYSTPTQKRGFGFSYSTYGTPGSPSSSVNTPLNLGGSMLGSSVGGGRLTKSMSSSSLRGSFGASREDSILAPGAFNASPSSKFNSTGSMKKLVINRAIRTDLFSPPPKDNGISSTGSPGSNSPGITKKRVSFDPNTVGGAINGRSSAMTSPLKQVDNSSATPSAEEMGYLRSPARSTNGNANIPASSTPSLQPEMEQVKGNELAIVREEEIPAQREPAKAAALGPQDDMEPGDYWMSPSREEIEDMNRMQRQKISNFIVGRHGVGKITFGAPVDLSNVNLDDLFGKLVQLDVRSATVYPDKQQKPALGKGMNVPSTIELYNSWPRFKDKRPMSHEAQKKRLSKHIERLSRVADTTFVDYDQETGVWIFTVPHYTTYGLDYDDDEETDGEGVPELAQSTMSAAPDTPTPKSRTPKTYRTDQSFSSTAEPVDSEPEDTFEFRRKKVLPGAFDNQEAFVEEDMDMDEFDTHHRQSFLDNRSADSQSDNGVDEPMEQDDVYNDRELVRIEDEIAGAYPNPDDSVELDDYPMDDGAKSMALETPGAVHRARLRAQRAAGTPSKNALVVEDDDWTGMLQKTVSPRKQDREHLKRMAESVNQGSALFERDEATPVANRVISDSRGFATSIDLMHSLFGEAKKSPLKKAPVKPKGFEWPYQKSSKNKDLDLSKMPPNDKAYHDSLKPSWGPEGTLVYAASAATSLAKSTRRRRERDGLLVVRKGGVISEGRDIRFASFSNESSAQSLQKQKILTAMSANKSGPFAQTQKSFVFSDFFESKSAQDPATKHEALVWELAGVLFDDIPVPTELRNVFNAESRIRKDKLSAFWQKLVEESTTRDVAMAKSSEEKSIASLSGHKIADACSHLLEGKNFHLATLIALIGENETSRKDMREQLNEWQKSRMLSEFSQPIRCLYEMLAGNVSVCDGTKSAPIEDRMQTFIISQRFGLDWRRAFGLRLWYAIAAADGLEVAVHKFFDDLQQDIESAIPVAWYVEQGIPPIWEDTELKTREDLLWGLLRLYSDDEADLQAVLRPENSQLSPLNVRLSWQLSCALTASGKVAYGSDAADKADQLTLSFASQLTAEGNWLDAVFVLLHLNGASSRNTMIQKHLAQHAENIGLEDSQSFITLNQEYKIPTSWIWEAKALYMRSVEKDAASEVQYLLNAGIFDEAHRTLVKEVAPRAVVEGNLETLRSLLIGFRDYKQKIKEWHLGGELYSDYIQLLDAQKSSLASIDVKLLDRLFSALPAMAVDARRPSFLEMVALQEISGEVAKIMVEMGKSGQQKNLPKVLNLPLTEDKYLKHAVDLSLGYYRSIMATGR